MVALNALLLLLPTIGATVTLDDTLSPLRTFTFVPSLGQDRVLSSNSWETATTCSHGAGNNVPSSAIIGDLALLNLFYQNACYTDGRYNHGSYRIEQGTLSSGKGASYPAYRVHPPAVRASQWLASGAEVYVRGVATGTRVHKFTGSDFITLPAWHSADVFKGTGIRADQLTSPLVLVLDNTGDLGAWPLLSPTVEGAWLTGTSGFSVSARRFQVGGDPFVPEEDWIDGPNSWMANYGIPKQFFPVDRADGREGVLWQDQTSHSVYMTWFAADLLSSDTTEVYEGRNHLVAAVANGAEHIVLVMVSETVPVGKSDSTPAFAIKVSSITGVVLLSKGLDTSKTGLNIHKFSEPGASIAWNTAVDKIGLCIARTMTVANDGLNHQGAIAVVLDGATLNVVKNLGQTSGHSFSNSLMVASDGTFLGMDLGDNFPRGIHVWRFDANTNWFREKFNVYNFKTKHATQSAGRAAYPEVSTAQTTYYKWSNDNNVYTELAHQGLIEVDDGLLVFFAGERPPLDNLRVGGVMNEPRNLGFVKVGKQLAQKVVLSSGAIESGGFYNYAGQWSTQSNSGINFLTSFSSVDESVSRPKTSRLAVGQNLLLWEVWTKTSYVRTQAMVVDDNGAMLQPLLTSGYPVRLPIADDLRTVGDRAIAYAGTTSGQLVRFEICTGSNCPTGVAASTTQPLSTTAAATELPPTTAAATEPPSTTVAATEAPSTTLSTTPPPSTTALGSKRVHSGDVIFLKAFSGSGNAVDIEDQLVQARWADRGDWQAIVIEKKDDDVHTHTVLSGDTVYLKTHTGKHIDVEGNSVRARWSDMGTWQSFRIEKHGLMLETPGGGPVDEAINENDIVCLRAHTGKNIDVQDGTLQARWGECGGWQKFRVEKEHPGAIRSGTAVLLRGHTGRRIDVEGDMVQCRWNEDGAWQRFVIENHGGRAIYSGDAVYLKAHTGSYMDVESDIARARLQERGHQQRFFIEKKSGGAIFPGDTVFLQAHTGKHISVEGLQVTARWHDHGLWQSLQIQKAAARRLQGAVPAEDVQEEGALTGLVFGLLLACILIALGVSMCVLVRRTWDKQLPYSWLKQNGSPAAVANKIQPTADQEDADSVVTCRD